MQPTGFERTWNLVMGIPFHPFVQQPMGICKPTKGSHNMSMTQSRLQIFCPDPPTPLHANAESPSFRQPSVSMTLQPTSSTGGPCYRNCQRRELILHLQQKLLWCSGQHAQAQPCEDDGSNPSSSVATLFFCRPQDYCSNHYIP